MIIKPPNLPSDPKAPKEPSVKVGGRKAKTKVVGVFGLPLVGKDSFIRAVLDTRPMEKIATISSGEIVDKLLTPETRAAMQQGGLYPLEEPLRAEIKRQMDAALKMGAKLILLNGFPRMGDQVQWLIDNYNDVGPSFLKLMPSQMGDLKWRAAKRARDEFDTDQVKLTARILKQSALIVEVERVIQMHMRPYYTIVNDSLQRAVQEFWQRFSL